jgi:hypothetical protein
MKAVTTRTGSGARLLPAHFAFTLAVCGGLLALVQVPSSSDRQLADSTLAAVCGIGAPAGHREWISETTVDPPDSSDDDDDDVPGGDAAIVVDAHHLVSEGHVSEPVHIQVELVVSRTVAGHPLRGPPTILQDSSADDPYGDDDGDDDDDDPDDDAGPVATHTTTSDVSRARLTGVVADLVTVPTLSYISHARALRAPPARTL